MVHSQVGRVEAEIHTRRPVRTSHRLVPFHPKRAASKCRIRVSIATRCRPRIGVSDTDHILVRCRIPVALVCLVGYPTRVGREVSGVDDSTYCLSTVNHQQRNDGDAAQDRREESRPPTRRAYSCGLGERASRTSCVPEMPERCNPGCMAIPPSENGVIGKSGYLATYRQYVPLLPRCDDHSIHAPREMLPLTVKYSLPIAGIGKKNPLMWMVQRAGTAGVLPRTLVLRKAKNRGL